MVESKVGSELKSFIKKNIVKKELTDELAVADKVRGTIDMCRLLRIFECCVLRADVISCLAYRTGLVSLVFYY